MRKRELLKLWPSGGIVRGRSGLQGVILFPEVRWKRRHSKVARPTGNIYVVWPGYALPKAMRQADIVLLWRTPPRERSDTEQMCERLERYILFGTAYIGRRRHAQA